MNLLKAITGIFSSSKASDTAVDIVRKITGTDGMTDKEKAEFVIQYLEVTKNQSVARRIIGIGMFAVYSLFCLTWLGVYFFINGEQVDHLQAFIKDMLLQPFNIVMGFYFTINIVKSLGNK